MFYSQFILAKKGPLATIWIAAHLERKLRKNQITDTNIGESVDSILYPEVPIALRLSGHLLLGVVRIYSRKVNLLFNDCSEALVKIHQAFQSSAVDLPPGAVVAPFNSITLPESFDFDDLETHLNREILAAQLGNRNDFEHHVTSRDLITLQEQNDDRRSLFTLDERFEDVGNPYAVLDLSLEELAPQKPLHISVPAPSEGTAVDDDILPPLPMDDEMDYDGINVDKDHTNIPSVIELDVRGKRKGLRSSTKEVPDVEKLRAASDHRKQEHLVGLHDVDEHKENSISMDVDDGAPTAKKGSDVGIAQNLEETPMLPDVPTPLHSEKFSPMRSNAVSLEGHDVLGSILGKRTPKLEVAPSPVSAKRAGKRRKEALDGAMSLSSADMKKQLKSTSDICRVRRRAPSTEYDIWMSKRDNHFEQRFSEPSFPGLCDEVRNIYEDVINQRIKLLKKPHTVDQVPLRRTPRRLDPDARVKTDDLKEARTGAAVEEAGVQIAVPNMPSLAEKLIENVEDVDGISCQREEAHSPDPEIAFAPPHATDEEGFDAAREQDEGISYKDRLDDAKDMREDEDGAATTADDHDGNGEVRPQGLGFLADPRDPDEPDNEMSTIEEANRSTSNDNGWSSRSRAVAMFLKDQYKIYPKKMLAHEDQMSLSLGNLLTGRTRREAARLFFETLVLESKGYIQVEQSCPYADIHLIASQRLMKATF